MATPVEYKVDTISVNAAQRRFNELANDGWTLRWLEFVNEEAVHFATGQVDSAGPGFITVWEKHRP